MIPRFLGWLLIFLLGTTISLTSLHTHLSTYKTFQDSLTKPSNKGSMGPMSYEKNCSVCGEGFTATMPHARYCSKECRQAQWYEPVAHDLSTGTVGALSELRAAADLLSKGYEVFRAMSPSTSCDLVILKDGKLTRVEVKSGRTNKKNGSICYATNNIRADVVAVVLHDRIIYHGILP